MRRPTRHADAGQTTGSEASWGVLAVSAGAGGDGSVMRDGVAADRCECECVHTCGNHWSDDDGDGRLKGDELLRWGRRGGGGGGGHGPKRALRRKCGADWRRRRGAREMRASKKLGAMRSSEAAERGPRAAEICLGGV